MEKIKETFADGSSNLRKILIGSGISILITIVFLLVFSILLTYTNISENTIPAITIIITAISIFIGSTMATSNLKKNGIINGAMVGLIYILVIYLLSSIIEKDFSLNIHSIIMIISSVLAGGIGGIIGINKGN